MAIVGTVREIWRYPVKSMAGEILESCEVGAAGIVGDRGWALRDDRAGEIADFTGISAAYEPPDSAEIVLRTGEESADESLSKILAALRDRLVCA